MKLAIPFIVTWSMSLWNEARAQQAQTTSSDIVSLDAVTFQQYMDDPSAKWFDAIVDVRTYNEWKSGHIANATLVESLALYNTSSNAATIGTPADLAGCEYCSIAVYCNSGARAGAALQLLRNAGFVGRLYNAQGVSQWIAAGFPLETTVESVTPPCKENATVSEQCRLSYLASTSSSSGGAAGSNTTNTTTVAATNTTTVAATNTTTVTPTNTTTTAGGSVPVASNNTTSTVGGGSSPAPPTQSSVNNSTTSSTCAAHSACLASNLTGLCCPSKL
jgi:rhodanese-related sulfurtransferase